MHPTFLERDSQVDALLGYAAEADAGAGRLVLVHGEAGGGKSTLLEHAEDHLPDASWHWGACDGPLLRPVHAPDTHVRLVRLVRAQRSRA